MANGRGKPQQENLVVEQFAVMQGMNTQEGRSGIAPGFWSWLMNLQPIGKHTLRALNGKAADIYTLLGGDTIVTGRTVIIGATYFAILFTLAGSAYQINLSTNAATTIGSAGTFYSGTGQYPHSVDVGNSGILIISPSGYWAWDGTTLFSAQQQAPLWVSGLTSAINTTGTTHSNKTLDGLGTTTGVVVGMGVIAADIPAGTTVTAINSSTSVSISNAASGSNAGEAVTFNWLMPSGVSGTAIEIFNASAWIVNGRTIIASAPGNSADFATSDGAVNLTVKDSFVQDGYSGLKQLDGFLYLFAHGGIDVISDVQTSGSPATTTFLRVNVSPVIGTPWRDSIVALPSSIVCANSTGAFEITGGQARKISDVFDGVFAQATYPAASTDPSGFHPSACAVTLNQTICYALTISLPDPDDTTNSFVPCLALWDGRRWFLGSQEVSPEVIFSQDNDSDLVAWSSTGTNLFKTFAAPSAALSKKAKSWFSVGDAGVTMRKEISRVYAQFGNTTSSNPLSSFNIDTESGSFAVPPLQAPVITWLNNTGGTVIWQNNSLQIVMWTAGFPLIIGGEANVIALMFGITVTTIQGTIDIIGLDVGYTDYSRYQ